MVVVEGEPALLMEQYLQYWVQAADNYLQENLETRRHDRLILAGKVPQICQAQAEGEFRGVWKRKSGRSEEEGVNGETC